MTIKAIFYCGKRYDLEKGLFCDEFIDIDNLKSGVFILRCPNDQIRQENSKAIEDFLKNFNSEAIKTNFTAIICNSSQDWYFADEKQMNKIGWYKKYEPEKGM